MQIISSFFGRNRDFKAWLRDQKMVRSLVKDLAAAVESGRSF